MDVVGENEALQQFFEGKTLVLRESLHLFLVAAIGCEFFGLKWRTKEGEEP